jgi:hypothetical protein
MTVPQILMTGDSPRARLTDPVTSHQAADSNNIAESTLVVLAILKGHREGLADWEVEHDHRLAGGDYTGQRLRTARSELVDAGAVVNTGHMKRNFNNRRTTVWCLTEEMAA